MTLLERGRHQYHNRVLWYERRLQSGASGVCEQKMLQSASQPTAPKNIASGIHYGTVDEAVPR